MNTITSLKRPPSDLAEKLREMADMADRGDLTDFVCAYCVSNGYDFVYGSSLHSCLVMAAMLEQNCIDRMRK